MRSSRSVAHRSNARPRTNRCGATETERRHETIRGESSRRPASERPREGISVNQIDENRQSDRPSDFSSEPLAPWNACVFDCAGTHVEVLQISKFPSCQEGKEG